MRLIAEIEACCPPIQQAPLNGESAELVATLLKAVADPARLRLLSMIGSCEAQEMCACDLTEPLDLSQPTVSHHLKVLTEAGLLTREKRGKWAYYRIDQDAMRVLRNAFS